MIGQVTGPAEGNRLLVFGPQALSLNAAAFQTLQSTVKQMRSNEWVLDTIVGLPQCWQAFVEQFPKYKVVEGAQMLTNLGEWFKTGKLDHSSPHLPNIVLSPLLMITHITEYMKYLDSSSLESRQEWDHPERSSTEILGFCMGFLSALAVSISKDRQQIETYGATAIRLAMLIGGIVDAQEKLDSKGPSKSFATAWTSSEAVEEMNKILRRFPEVNNSSIVEIARKTYVIRHMFPFRMTNTEQR